MECSLKIPEIGKKESIAKKHRLFNDLRKTIVSLFKISFNNYRNAPERLIL